MKRLPKGFNLNVDKRGIRNRDFVSITCTTTFCSINMTSMERFSPNTDSFPFRIEDPKQVVPVVNR